MIIVNDNNSVYLSWRENGKRKTENLLFDPYFFIEADSKKPQFYRVNKYLQGQFRYEKTAASNLEGKALVKACY